MSASREPNRSFEPKRSARSWSPPAGRRRIEDARDRANLLKILLWSPAGFALGVALGWYLTRSRGAPGWTVPALGLVGWAFVVVLPLAAMAAAARAAGTLYAPTGSSTPHPREHSRAMALVARGLHEDAVAELARAVDEDAADSGACLLIARILRDELGRHEDAGRWLRRALESGSLGDRAARAVRRELIELYTSRMGAPERAAPELARMAEELAGTAEGDWAVAELRAIKRDMRADGGTV